VPPIASFARSPPAPKEGARPALASTAPDGVLAADATAVDLRAAFLGSRPGGAAMEGMLALAAAAPACTPLVNCALQPLLYPTLESRELSYLVQCNEHRGVSESAGVRFEVSEFALPAAAAAAALRELVGALRDGSGMFLSFPVRARVRGGLGLEPCDGPLRPCALRSSVVCVGGRRAQSSAREGRARAPPRRVRARWPPVRPSA
jgi:hypothetical protein